MRGDVCVVSTASRRTQWLRGAELNAGGAECTSRVLNRDSCGGPREVVSVHVTLAVHRMQVCKR